MSSPVAQTAPSVTLFLPNVPSGGIKALAKSVTDLLRDLGLQVQSSEEISAEVTRFITSGPEITVSLQSTALDPRQTDTCERPEYGQALDQYALRKLEAHRAVIGINVEDARGRVEARTRQSLALTLRLARGLVGETGADLVLWEQTRVLYTVGEFSGLGQPSKQRRPLVSQRSSGVSPRSDLTGADAALSAAVSATPGSPLLPRQTEFEPSSASAEGLNSRVEDLAAPLYAEALRRQEGATAKAALALTAANLAIAASEAEASAKPNHPPARLTAALRWFGAQFDTWLDEAGYPTRKMQASVYLMVLLALLISPIFGGLLLAYNLLRRESLKVTVPALLALAGAKALGWLDIATQTLTGMIG